MSTSPTRIYASGIVLLLFFVLWLAIAVRPWPEQATATPDPRLAGLAAREKRLRAEALAIQRRLRRQWAEYQRDLAIRRQEIAAVTLRHEQAVALAAAAARRMASTRAASPANEVIAPASALAPISPPAPAPAEPPPPKVKVVELPPQVQVVELPPITVSSAS